MEHVFYINLEHRIDRKETIESQMNMLDISFTRVDAIYNKNGAIGCGLSHIKALKMAYETDRPYSIILEDDYFIFNHNNFKEFNNAFKKVCLDNIWDTIVMTPRGDTIETIDKMSSLGFKRIHNNQTATGYIIKKDIIPILINNLKEAVSGLIKKLDPNTYAIDQFWKRLQDKYAFYYYKEIFAGQLPGYSDIEKRHVDYNERFINQVKF